MANSEGTPSANGANDWGRTNTTWVKQRDLAVLDADGKWVPFDLVSVTEGMIKNKPSFIFHLAGDRAFSVNKERSTAAAQIARIGHVPPAGRYVVELSPTRSKSNTEGYDLVLKGYDPNAPPVSAEVRELVARVAAKHAAAASAAAPAA